jgi:hypothetical protein
MDRIQKTGVRSRKAAGSGEKEESSSEFRIASAPLYLAVTHYILTPGS